MCNPASVFDRLELAKEIIEAIKPYWDRIYPEKIFDGSSGDPGAKEVVEIRKMIEHFLNGDGFYIPNDDCVVEYYKEDENRLERPIISIA